MSEENVELLKRAWAAYDAGDVEGFAACLTDNWRESDPSDPSGGFGTLDDERRAMESHKVAFPDKHTEIHHIVADEELVACHCTVTATHTGPYMGLEATGKSVVVHEMMFNLVRDGKLAETWAMTSGAGFYDQLTGEPAPEQLDNMG
jgi:predicted ester cyclase